eukprot:6704621-Prymnesium_polylepis.1
MAPRARPTVRARQGTMRVCAQPARRRCCAVRLAGQLVGERGGMVSRPPTGYGDTAHTGRRARCAGGQLRAGGAAPRDACKARRRGQAISVSSRRARAWATCVPARSRRTTFARPLRAWRCRDAALLDASGCGVFDPHPRAGPCRRLDGIRRGFDARKHPAHHQARDVVDGRRRARALLRLLQPVVWHGSARQPQPDPAGEPLEWRLVEHVHRVLPVEPGAQQQLGAEERQGGRHAARQPGLQPPVRFVFPVADGRRDRSHQHAGRPVPKRQEVPRSVRGLREGLPVRLVPTRWRRHLPQHHDGVRDGDGAAHRLQGAGQVERPVQGRQLQYARAHRQLRPDPHHLGHEHGSARRPRVWRRLFGDACEPGSPRVLRFPRSAASKYDNHSRAELETLNTRSRKDWATRLVASRSAAEVEA